MTWTDSGPSNGGANGSGRAVSFPLRLDGYGRTVTVPTDTAVRELLAELLFTSPGERLNRPELGCGLIELIFDASTDELRAATQFQVTATIQQWLGDVLTVVAVEVRSFGTTIEVAVKYRLPSGGDVMSTTVSL
jgi:phage baseplate assembly protein W